MDKFTLYWKDGSKDVVTGVSIDNAFSLAGYGSDAIEALDFFMCGECNDFVYDAVDHNWENKRLITPVVFDMLEKPGVPEYSAAA